MRKEITINMINRDDILLSTIDIVKEDFNRNLCGVEQVKVGGIWVSLNTYVYEITAVTGATYDLDGKITNEGLELSYPCHYPLNMSVYRNGILQPVTKYTLATTGVITPVDAYDDDNLIFIFK